MSSGGFGALTGAWLDARAGNVYNATTFLWELGHHASETYGVKTFLWRLFWFVILSTPVLIAGGTFLLALVLGVTTYLTMPRLVKACGSCLSWAGGYLLVVLRICLAAGVGLGVFAGAFYLAIQNYNFIDTMRAWNATLY
jgi:hypothetical protein